MSRESRTSLSVPDQQGALLNVLPRNISFTSTKQTSSVYSAQFFLLFSRLFVYGTPLLGLNCINLFFPRSNQYRESLDIFINVLCHQITGMKKIIN